MPGPIWRDSLIGALAGTPETAWNLTTLNGLNAGGVGNEITISKDECFGLIEPDLLLCVTERTVKENEKGLADGTLIIDPITGGVIPNPAAPVPALVP
jgi:hypothetical protein